MNKLIFLFLIFANVLYAQEIEGVLADETSKKPLRFAEVN